MVFYNKYFLIAGLILISLSISCDIKNPDLVFKEDKCASCTTDIISLNKKLPGEIMAIDEKTISESETRRLKYQLNKNLSSKSKSELHDKISWNDTKTIEYKSGLKAYITPVEVIEERKKISEYNNHNNKLLISYENKGKINQVFFEGNSNITKEQYLNQ